ncbi:MAG TPA: LytTR family transcriptional regulator DNA-binding domain-containing protein [Thermoanaerobaculia bacterium]|nr:LytTR family transcriptional regulator DNA-binding domain-containing protein [Thermoanaerobaculia bacterium]
MSEAHKQTSRRWHEAWATPAQPAAYEACLASDFRGHVPGHGWVDRHAYARCVRTALGPFAAARVTIEEIAAEDEAVMLRLSWTLCEGERGETASSLVGCAVDRFRDGRVAEHLLVFDRPRDAAAPPPARRASERLTLRSTGRVGFLKTAEIEWVDAAHNYARIHTLDGKTHVAREPIGAIEARLDRERFLRIHRSTIINADCVRELELSTHGDYVAILSSGQRLTISRSFRDRLPALIGA